MGFFNRRPGNRSIAAMMLFVWLFSLTAGIANACATDEVGSALVAGVHHNAISSAVTIATVATAGDDQHAAATDDKNQQWSHRVHCQTIQFAERKRMSGQKSEKQFDLPPMFASVSGWPRAALLIARSPSQLAVLRVSTDLPLFIRFRRLIP